MALNIVDAITALENAVSGFKSAVTDLKSGNVAGFETDVELEGEAAGEGLTAVGLGTLGKVVQSETIPAVQVASTTFAHLVTDGVDILSLFPDGTTSKLGIKLEALNRKVNGN